MAIAIFTTWTTYGTWLPGDHRGWFYPGLGLQLPDTMLKFHAALQMTDDAVTLDFAQRQLVEKTVAAHCDIRKWSLHAVNCRTNHVHVAVTAPDRKISDPRIQFKAWCTRRIMERERETAATAHIPVREEWWTERGWDEYVDDDESLMHVINYIRNCQ